jgi:ankyrin repeat protein
LKIPAHEQIQDAAFRRAVDLLDSGETGGLRAHLRDHPALVRQRVSLEVCDYFRNPTLLEFVAENPIRRGSLPPNVVEVAKVILDEGARADRASVDAALALVSSGKVPRECDVQVALIDLLCDYGADADIGMLPALVHGELEAAHALIRRGAKVDLAVAGATGRIDDVRKMLAAADTEGRHRALALAAQHGHLEVVRLLLDAGEDPNRYNPPGCHAHSTPLHQAVLAGHDDVVRLLVERGASLDIKDTIFQGTPLGWAQFAGRIEIMKLVS